MIKGIPYLLAILIAASVSYFGIISISIQNNVSNIITFLSLSIGLYSASLSILIVSPISKLLYSSEVKTSTGITTNLHIYINHFKETAYLSILLIAYLLILNNIFYKDVSGIYVLSDIYFINAFLNILGVILTFLVIIKFFVLIKFISRAVIKSISMDN